MTFTAAVVQMASNPNDSLATATAAADRLREAAAHGAKLVVFPEALIGGYPPLTSPASDTSPSS